MFQTQKAATRSPKNAVLLLLWMVAASVHILTALLRLGVFVPYPKIIDFASFYGAAYVLGQQRSPYGWTPETLALVEGRIPVALPDPNSTTAWLWLIWPLTHLPFETASLVWLMVLLLLTVLCAYFLTQIAGYTSRVAWLLVFLLTLTFGPMFLTLTLGQNSLFLLFAALIGGRNLWRRNFWWDISTGVSWGIAISAKLFPALWFFGLFLLRRWQTIVIVTFSTLLLFISTHLIFPAASQDYWYTFLPSQVGKYSSAGALDDQALGAWLDRMTRAQTLSASGLSVDTLHTIQWEPILYLLPEQRQILTYGLLLISAGVVILALWRYGANEPEAAFYLWILLCMLAVPHMERYNHVLLLPGMAWSWSRGAPGQLISLLTYGLAGAARLTHFWILWLPSPWTSVFTGFGIIATFVLLGGMVYLLSRSGRTQ